MTIVFTNGSLAMVAGQAISGVVRRAMTWRVTSGRVWITEEGDPHDHWLGAGETFSVTPGRLVVIEAGTSASRITTTQLRSSFLLHKLTTLAVQAARRLMHGCIEFRKSSKRRAQSLNIRDLREMSCHMLKDLGFRRGEIASPLTRPLQHSRQDISVRHAWIA